MIKGFKAVTYPKTSLKIGLFFAICSRIDGILTNILVKKIASQIDGK